MSLLSSTQSILRQAEAFSGRPVHVEEDPSLQPLATVQIARGTAPLHLVRYKSTAHPDYLIAFQCGFIIRLYETPADRRVDLGASDTGQKKVDELLLDPSLPSEVRRMRDYMLNGLLTQLRSIPIGLRVDDWLAKDFPELQELQRQAAQRQLEEGTQVIRLGAKKAFPPKIYRANVSMNAAFALFWSRKWNDNKCVLPYKATGYLEGGERLLKIFDRTSPEAVNDAKLVDEWAHELGITGWYRWVPYSLNE